MSLCKDKSVLSKNVGGRLEWSSLLSQLEINLKHRRVMEINFGGDKEIFVLSKLGS